MRKIILIVILAVSIFLCYTVVSNGVELGQTFKISNFKEVEDASKQVDTLISQLVNVNDIEYKDYKVNVIEMEEPQKKYPFRIYGIEKNR